MKKSDAILGLQQQEGWSDRKLLALALHFVLDTSLLEEKPLLRSDARKLIGKLPWEARLGAEWAVRDSVWKIPTERLEGAMSDIGIIDKQKGWTIDKLLSLTLQFLEDRGCLDKLEAYLSQVVAAEEKLGAEERVAAEQRALVDRLGLRADKRTLARLGTLRFKHVCPETLLNVWEKWRHNTEKSFSCCDFSADGTKFVSQVGFLLHPENHTVVGNICVWDVPSGDLLLTKNVSINWDSHIHEEWNARISEDGNSLVVDKIPRDDDDFMNFVRECRGERLAEDEQDEEEHKMEGHEPFTDEEERERLEEFCIKEFWETTTDSIYHDPPETETTTSPPNDGNSPAPKWKYDKWEEGSEIIIRQADTGKPLIGDPGHTDIVRAVSFSPDGGLLASAGDDRTVRIWFPSGYGKQCLRGHERRVESVCFSPDGLVASGSVDRTVRIWHLRSGEQVRILPHEGEVRLVQFSQDGTVLLTYEEVQKAGQVALWDVQTGARTAQLREEALLPQGEPSWKNPWEVEWACFGPGNRPLAFVRGKNVLELRDVESGQTAYSLPIPSWVHHLETAALSPDGRMLAASLCHQDRMDRTDSWQIQSWHLPTGQVVQTFAVRQRRIQSLLFLPGGDGDIVAVGGGDWWPEYWSGPYDAPSEKPHYPSSEKEQSRDHGIEFWNARSGSSCGTELSNCCGRGEQVARWPQHDHVVYALACTKDGRLWASGGHDTTIIVSKPADLPTKSPEVLGTRSELSVTLAGPNPLEVETPPAAPQQPAPQGKPSDELEAAKPDGGEPFEAPEEIGIFCKDIKDILARPHNTDAIVELQRQRGWSDARLLALVRRFILETGHQGNFETAIGQWGNDESGTERLAGYSLIQPGADELYVRLMRLGAKWDARRSEWVVPDDNADEAIALSPKLKIVELGIDDLRMQNGWSDDKFLVIALQFLGEVDLLDKCEEWLRKVAND